MSNTKEAVFLRLFLLFHLTTWRVLCTGFDVLAHTSYLAPIVALRVLRDSPVIRVV